MLQNHQRRVEPLPKGRRNRIAHVSLALGAQSLDVQSRSARGQEAAGLRAASEELRELAVVARTNPTGEGLDAPSIDALAGHQRTRERRERIQTIATTICATLAALWFLRWGATTPAVHAGMVSDGVAIVLEQQMEQLRDENRGYRLQLEAYRQQVEAQAAENRAMRDQLNRLAELLLDSRNPPMKEPADPSDSR